LHRYLNKSKMNFLTNIRTVATYESKLLLRSWFFRIFAALLLLFILSFNSALAFGDGPFWRIRSIASNVPYINLLYVNFVQAIIAVFLASDFMKRDKQLDTSEVFFVHPLSNAAYVFGKIWGNVRIFLVLDLVLMATVALFNMAATGVGIDWPAYAEYFFIITVPALVFIIGLSVFLMLLFRNQAVTFIVLLAYIGLSVFYLKSKFYFLFDYMAYAIPLVKSSVTGFAAPEVIICQRAIYLFAGLGFICITITLFGRLPNSPRSHRPWMALAIASWTASAVLGYRYVDSILDEGRMRTLYTEINNRHVADPKMLVEDYVITLRQHPHSVTAEARLKGTASATAQMFTFCLNPSLVVDSVVAEDGRPLAFSREQQILTVDMGREIGEGEPVGIGIKYGGTIDSRFCYLDIPEKTLTEYASEMMITCGRQFGFITPRYLLLTPETCWYPRPGTTFSNVSPDWQQTYFSWFDLRVTPLPGLTPVSQGEVIAQSDSLSVRFLPESPLQSISLVVGDYRKQSVKSDGIEFAVWHFEGHDYYTPSFDSIADRIPQVLSEQLENLERNHRLDYPFNRIAVVETPAQFASFPHTWSQAQETVQPEIILFPEKAWLFDGMNVRQMRDSERRRGDRQQSVQESQSNSLRQMLNVFTQEQTPSFDRNRAAAANPYFIYPELFNFRFNIYSARWTVANRIVELYLQNRQADRFRAGSFRGINNYEMANLLMAKHSFSSLLADTEYRNIVDYITLQKASQLFARAEMNMGQAAFRDSVFAVLKRNEFSNIRFENLLDTLAAISQTPIEAATADWNSATVLPYFHVERPEIRVVTDRGQETVILSVVMENPSPTDGIVRLNVQTGGGRSGGGRGGGMGGSSTAADPKTNRNIELRAGECKQIVMFLDDLPRSVSVNTLVSENLPNEFTFNADNVLREQRPIVETEGDFTVLPTAFVNLNERIVDNEDSLLFTVSATTAEGLLPRWLHRDDDTQFRYKNLPWFTVNEWLPAINPSLYGKSIRSAMVISGGKGDRTATWNVPIHSAGTYEIYYHLCPAPSRDWRRRNRGDRDRNQKNEYVFRFRYGNAAEDAFLDFSNETGWKKFRDNYYIDADTLSITLTNKGKTENYIVADAVKVVRID